MLPKQERSMKKDDYVAIDVRWQNAGWTEAFRLRLTEWLPQEEITIGIENGVLEPVANQDFQTITITEKELLLTEPTTSSFSEENCAMLAVILQMRNYSDTWLGNKPKQSASLSNCELAFNDDFKTKMCQALKSRSRSSQTFLIPEDRKSFRDDI